MRNLTYLLSISHFNSENIPKAKEILMSVHPSLQRTILSIVFIYIKSISLRVVIGIISVIALTFINPIWLPFSLLMILIIIFIIAGLYYRNNLIFTTRNNRNIYEFNDVGHKSIAQICNFYNFQMILYTSFTPAGRVGFSG